MSAERSLFDDTMEMADLVRHIERVADQKCLGFHISFGMSKGANGHKTYTSIVVLETKHKNPSGHTSTRQIIHGDSVRSLFDQANNFLKTV